MEDFLGIIVFLIFIGLSMAKRATQGQEKGRNARRTGEAGVPLPPRPMESTPMHRPPPQPAWPDAPQPVARARTMDDEESSPGENAYGMSGAGDEGPTTDERVQAGMDRFQASTAQFKALELGRGWTPQQFASETQGLGKRRINQEWTDELSSQEDVATVTSRGPGITVTLPELNDRNSMARAMVMSEVLGPPKALRNRRRR